MLGVIHFIIIVIIVIVVIIIVIIIITIIIIITLFYPRQCYSTSASGAEQTTQTNISN